MKPSLMPWWWYPFPLLSLDLPFAYNTQMQTDGNGNAPTRGNTTSSHPHPHSHCDNNVMMCHSSCHLSPLSPPCHGNTILSTLMLTQGHQRHDHNNDMMTMCIIITLLPLTHLILPSPFLILHDNDNNNNMITVIVQLLPPCHRHCCTSLMWHSQVYPHWIRVWVHFGIPIWVQKPYLQVWVWVWPPIPGGIPMLLPNDTPSHCHFSPLSPPSPPPSPSPSWRQQHDKLSVCFCVLIFSPCNLQVNPPQVQVQVCLTDPRT